jgi:glycosyltransferase involved in cell wall biosynthesis
MYNVGKYVGAMLESCFAQTYKNLEVCLFNDGSTDDSVRVVRQRASTGGRIYISDWEHRGVNRAFNQAFLMARGDIIARLDADDTMHPTRLEKQVALIEAGADIVTCEMNRMDEDGSNLRPKPVGPMDPEAYLSGRSPHAPIDATIVCRREVYEQVGLWNPAYPWAAVDEWIIRALDFGFKWAHVPEFLYNYRTRPGQTVKQSKGRSEATYQWLIERAKAWKQRPASQS